MSKLYISKNDLEQLLNKEYKDNSYPKPLLTAITIILTMIIIIIAIISVLLYALLFWIDIIIGKYVIKRIFKK